MSAKDKVWRIKANAKAEVRVGLHECAECKKQFRVTAGTIFEDSKIPLRKWLVTFYMICSSKKGISSFQLQRNPKLGSYRTALFMTRCIRYALKSEAFTARLDGPTELDKTYVGGKVKGKGRHYMGNKQTVVSIVSRKGEKRSFHVAKVNASNLQEAITEHVAEGSTVMTDESKLYNKVGHTYVHETVNHGKKEYAQGSVTTNTVKSSFALIKRGVYGTFHNVSKKHLHLSTLVFGRV